MQLLMHLLSTQNLFGRPLSSKVDVNHPKIMSTSLLKVKVMRIYATLGWQLLIASASAFNADLLGKPFFFGYAWMEASILLNQHFKDIFPSHPVF